MTRNSLFEKEIKNFENLDFCFSLCPFLTDINHGFTRISTDYGEFFQTASASIGPAFPRSKLLRKIWPYPLDSQ